MPDEQQLTERQTAGYRPPPPLWSTLFDMQRLPAWNYNWAEAMDGTPQVAFGVSVGHSPMYQSEVEVVCDDETVAQYAAEQWRTLWSRYAKRLLTYDRAGYGALEVIYKWDEETQELGIDAVCDFHPSDIKALTRDGQLMGVRVRSTRITKSETVDLYGPKFVWLKYDADYGRLYGRSLYRGAFEPWMEKTKSGGATDLRRLRFIKDSWIGDVARYPTKIERIPDGNGGFYEISGHDLIDQVITGRAAGGMMKLPSTRDDKGEYEYDYQAPQNISGATDILAYVDTLDWDIWKGLLVPREVIEAATSGSGFSGRTVPMVAFLAMRDVQLMDIVTSFKHVFDFLVEYKFGRKIPFTMRPKPLIEQFAENVGGTEAAGPLEAGQDRPMMNSLFGTPNDAQQFAIGEEPTIQEQANAIGMELGGHVRRSIREALKKNYLPSS
ncbi:MAG: hypothetical protein QM811_07065 [Pirellulales bacterium]